MWLNLRTSFWRFHQCQPITSSTVMCVSVFGYWRAGDWMRKSENWQREKLRGRNEVICWNTMLPVSKTKKKQNQKRMSFYSDLSFVSFVFVACLCMLFCSPKGFPYSIFSLRMQVKTYWRRTHERGGLGVQNSNGEEA